MNDFKKEGKKVAIVAISSNCLLTVLNIVVGLMSGSYALISEGAHTLSDVATSIIAYIGFKIGQKPADLEHPMGHGRAEAICGLVIVLFLAIVGYEIIETATEKLMNPALITSPDIYAALMALFGIFINYLISTYIIKIGKKINSPAIIADGKHQRTDIFSSVAILLGVIVANLGYPILDPIIGLIIGILILITAYQVGKENINNIMGKIPSTELNKKIEDIANKTKGAGGAHNIKVNYFGSYAIVTLHIQVDGNMTVDEAHKITHLVEKNITCEMDIIKSASVHACPIGLNYNHEQEIDK